MVPENPSFLHGMGLAGHEQGDSGWVPTLDMGKAGRIPGGTIPSADPMGSAQTKAGKGTKGRGKERNSQHLFGINSCLIHIPDLSGNVLPSQFPSFIHKH